MIKTLSCFFYIILGCIPLYAQHSTPEKLEQLYVEVTIGKCKNTDVDDSLSEINSILATKTISAEERAKALLILCNLYRFKGDNAKALKTAEEASSFASLKHLYLWQARFLGFLSTEYRRSNMIALGEKKLIQAIEVSMKSPQNDELYRFYANAYHEMAYYAASYNDYRKALSYMKYSNHWAEKMTDSKKEFFLASNYQYIGILFNRLSKADSALYYFNRALKLVESNKSDIGTQTLKNYIYTNMGESYLMQKNLPSAYKLLTKVLKDSLKFKTQDLNQNLYGNWVNYYQYTGNLDSLKLYNSRLDSISFLINTNNTNAINSVTDNLILENKSLKKNDRLHWYIAIALLAFLTVLTAIFQKRKHKANGIIKNGEIKSESVNIAKDTELRITEQLKAFEESRQYLDPDVSSTLLANQFSTNTRYVTYMVKKLYDKDLNTYINELRIQHILDLLHSDHKYRQVKIGHLAEIAGFSSHSKFAAVFKKVKGCSPSEYLNTLDEQK